MNRKSIRNAGVFCIATASMTVTSCRKNKASDQEFSQGTVVLSLDRSEISSGNNEAQYTVKLTSKVKWTATSGSDAWILVDKNSGNGSSELKVTIKGNTNNDSRTGKLAFKAEGVTDLNLTIHQKGLIEWNKVVPNNNNYRVMEVADGYVLAGEKNGNIYVYKVDKTTMNPVKTLEIKVDGYPGSGLYDIEPLSGGGFIATAILNKIADGSQRDVYVFQLNNALEIVKQQVIDFGDEQDIPFAITPLGNGFVLALLQKGNICLTRLDKNLLEIAGTRKPSGMSGIRDLKTANNDELIVAGSSDDRFAVARFSTDLTLKSLFRKSFYGNAMSAWISADNTIAIAGNRSAEGTDIYYAKLDTDLNLVAGQEFSLNKTEWDEAISIIGLTGGGYAISGSVMIDSERQGFSFRLNNDMTVIEGKEVIIPVSFMQYVLGSCPLSDGSYLVTGMSRSPAYASQLVRINP